MCDTDAHTIDLVIREIVAQLRYKLKSGAGVRLMFKIGKLIGKGGRLLWKSFRDEEREKSSAPTEASSALRDAASFVSSAKGTMVNSRFRRDLSVLTPSLASRVKSQTPRDSLHMSNPNPPAQHSARYKGVGYGSASKYESLIDPADAVRFGKQVSYGQVPTNEQVVNSHLSQMR